MSPTSPQGQRTSFAYDNAGRRTLKKLANGSRTSFSYDLANRISSVAQLKSDGSVQAKYEYKYDKAGNRTAMAETGHTTARTTWSYDAAYQLTGEHRTGTNAYRNTYVYDNRGNRTLKNLDGVRTTSSYDDANQLKWTQDASGRTTYTFDADGNQQVVLTPAGQRTTSVWDYENKLVGVLNPSGTRETMAYDADGRRVKHQTASETAKYVWDQENYLAETNASDATQAVYTNEPRTYGNLISQRRSGATHYYVFDALGSTRLLTDSLEVVSESLLYDAWGNLVGSSPSMTVPFRWVGELGYLFVPSTSDYYVRARVYRPTIGRWVSQDPMGLADGYNRFRISSNNTIVITDPTGRWILKCQCRNPDSIQYFRLPDAITKDCNTMCRLEGWGKEGEDSSFSTDEWWMIDLCTGMERAARIACEKRITEILNDIENTWVSELRGDAVVQFFAYYCRISPEMEPVCTAWCNEWVKQDATRPNIRGSCIMTHYEIIPWPARGGPEHGIILVRNTCTNKCVAFDQGALGGPDHIFDPGNVGSDTGANFAPEDVPQESIDAIRQLMQDYGCQ